MNALSDAQLLRDFASTGSEEAFAELVRRYVDLVYSAALRMVCDSHLAQDVTQGTFLALSRNASELVECSFLSGWLHRTAQNIAAQTVRTEVRRRVREEKASIMNEVLAGESEADWGEVSQHLDAALGELSEVDRGVILQRYFERRSAQEISVTLGVSEDAAQRRVARAVQRLRDFFAKRGVTVGTGGIIALVSAHAVEAAPLGMAASVTAAIAMAGTTGATSAVTGTAFKFMATTLLKPILMTGAAIAVSVALVVQHQRMEALGKEKLGLQTQLAQNEATVAELVEKAKKGSGQVGSDPRLAELVQLRNEVSRLHALEAEWSKERQAALKQAAGKAATDAARQETEEQFEARLTSQVSGFKQIGLKLRVMDRKKTLNDAFAANGQIHPALLSQELPGFDMSQVEFLLPDASQLGKVTDTEPETIIARSRVAELQRDGTWIRMYLLADGSVQRKSTLMPNQAYEGKWQLVEGR